MRQYVLPAVAVVLLVALLFFLLRPGDIRENELEIFSWWTAIGEEEGLEALYRLYREQNPGVDIINATVVGGAGFNARSVLDRRLDGGNPPDAFQVIAGPGLMNSWIKPGYLEDLSSIYREQDLFDLLPEVITDKLRYRGGIYAIPINIHRENVLWYNISLFRRYGISPPHSHKELIEVMKELAAKGITPLALGDRNTWTASHLLESIMVANLGGKKYRGLWTDRTDWSSPAMETALEEFLELLEYVNSDHGAMTWDEAVQYMVDGKCAMTVMGDFAEGYLTAKGLEPKVDFGWVPFPETAGVFVMNSDTFALPKGAVHRENALEWLRLIGSKKGQDAFNPKKGSIPARRDARGETENYDAYQKTALRAFEEKEIVNSFTHSSTGTDAWRNEFNRIVDTFMVEQNVSETLRRLEEAEEEHL